MTHFRGSFSPLYSIFFFLSTTLLPFCAAQVPIKFGCSGETKCWAMAAYVPPAKTTYGAIKDLFQVGSIYDLYGVNGVNESTPISTKVPANATVRVPFPCYCTNGTGVSDGKPIYTTKAGDSLKKIAAETFGGLVTDLQIAAANGIANASSIVDAGRPLLVPLPCSCDYFFRDRVRHLAHVVREETKLADIAHQYSVYFDRLVFFNEVSNSKSLVPGQVLDVPLYVCSSPLPDDSLNSRFYLPNGTYALTARNCIKCSCNGPGGDLDCQLSPDSVTNKSTRCKREICSANPFQGLGVHYMSICKVPPRCIYAGCGNPSPPEDNPFRKSSSAAAAEAERGHHLSWTLLLFAVLLAQ